MYFDKINAFEDIELLLEYGFKNFFSFKEGASISLKLDSNCPTNISRGLDFTTVLGIKGANGSGKTTVLKAFAFLSHFCCDSFSDKLESRIPIDSFYDSKEPSEFYSVFIIGENTYTYELSLTGEKVLSETIFRKKASGKKIKIVHRIEDKLIPTKEFERLKAIKLRKNASLISTAHQYDFNELEELYLYFKQTIYNVSFSGLHEIPYDISLVSRFIKEDKQRLEFVKNFSAKCDTGISDIRIIEIEDETKKKKLVPIFVHKVNDKEQSVTQYTESSGTKALYRNLPSYHLILKSGGVMIVDELETHLHPHLLPKLIELFLDPKINKKNAQLIFSTHDAEIINLLGRYRTYLVNKEDNESFTYRLDEIPGDILRNDRPILPAYTDGKIGGIPRL